MQARKLLGALKNAYFGKFDEIKIIDLYFD